MIISKKELNERVQEALERQGERDRVREMFRQMSEEVDRLRIRVADLEREVSRVGHGSVPTNKQ